MFNDTYHTIAAPAEGLYKEKGSKFLAFAYPVHNTDEVKQHLEALRKEYFDARHHCYAYILGPNKDAYRVNDDGEPSGTGGRPIHGQLLSADLTDTLIVVVRYFGGILLGTSGLIVAYKSAAADAIANAQIIEKTATVRCRVEFDYLQMNAVMKCLKDFQLAPQNTVFENACSLEVDVRLTMEHSFLESMNKICICTKV